MPLVALVVVLVGVLESELVALEVLEDVLAGWAVLSQEKPVVIRAILTANSRRISFLVLTAVLIVASIGTPLASVLPVDVHATTAGNRVISTWFVSPLLLPSLIVLLVLLCLLVLLHLTVDNSVPSDGLTTS